MDRRKFLLLLPFIPSVFLSIITNSKNSNAYSAGSNHNTKLNKHKKKNAQSSGTSRVQVGKNRRLNQKQEDCSFKITEECIACGACEQACPVKAIYEGYPIYTINANICIGCEGYSDTPICIEICPVEAIVPC